MCEREGETEAKDKGIGLRLRLTVDCYINTFLNHDVSLYSGLYVISSLTGGSQSRVADCLPNPLTDWIPSDLPTDRVSVGMCV